MKERGADMKIFLDRFSSISKFLPPQSTQSGANITIRFDPLNQAGSESIQPPSSAQHFQLTLTLATSFDPSLFVAKRFSEKQDFRLEKRWAIALFAN